MKLELSRKHQYLIDGKEAPGVTSILGIVDKPAIKYWYAKQAIAFVMENWEFFKGRNIDDVKEKFFQAIRHPSDKTRRSADLGSLAHFEIERLSKGLIVLEQADQQVRHVCAEFLRWAKENDFSSQKSEVGVASLDHWYAGTLDYISSFRGELWLWDYKSGKNMYASMGKQLAAYRCAYRESYAAEPQPTRMGILRIGVQNRDFAVEEFEDYPFHLNWFLRTLELYKAEKEGEKRWLLKHPKSKEKSASSMPSEAS